MHYLCSLGAQRGIQVVRVTQPQRCPPGPERDRHEITPRLERGYFSAAAEGNQSQVSAADFERCLQLAAPHLGDREVCATLLAVRGYNYWRADLRSVEQLLAVLKNCRGGTPMIGPGHRCRMGDGGVAERSICARASTFGAGDAAHAQVFG